MESLYGRSDDLAFLEGNIRSSQVDFGDGSFPNRIREPPTHLAPPRLWSNSP